MDTKKKDKYMGVLSTISGKDIATAPAPKTKETVMESLDPETQELVRQREIVKAVRAEMTRQRQPKRYKQYTRTSFTIAPQTLAKMKELAKLQNTTLKEIAMLAFDQAIETYESKHGEIKPSEKNPETLTELFK